MGSVEVYVRFWSMIYSPSRFKFKQLFLSEIEFKFQWQVNHGPGSDVEFSFPYKLRTNFCQFMSEKVSDFTYQMKFSHRLVSLCLTDRL